MSRWLSLGAAIVLAQLVFHPAQAQDGATYRVRSDVSQGIQNMRSGPGTGHAIVTSIPAGSGGVVLTGGCRDPDDGSSRYQWCKFRWSGYEGWISRNGLELASSGASRPPTTEREAPVTRKSTPPAEPAGNAVGRAECEAFAAGRPELRAKCGR